MSTGPTVSPLSEEQEDRLPVLCRVIDRAGPRQETTLFIGNRVAADDPDLLFRHDITATMNLAVNIELLPLDLADGTVVRRTHIGLIDGPGNRPQHLLAATLALHGILGQSSPGKAHYPPHRKGNVLVHCRGGRSRSVTVLALYLHLVWPERFASLTDALNHLRALRGLETDQPQPALLELAGKVIASLGDMPSLFRND